MRTTSDQPARPGHTPSRTRLTKLDKVGLAICSAWLIFATADAAHHSADLQLLAMLLLLCLLGAILTSAVLIVARWRSHGPRALLPLIVCLCVLFAPVELARPIRAGIRAWAFPSYEALVARMQSGQINVPASLTRLSGVESQARLAYSVLASRDSNSVLIVEILTEGGFPVKHSGYLYCSALPAAPDSLPLRDWKRNRSLGRGWYEISD